MAEILGQRNYPACRSVRSYADLSISSEVGLETMSTHGPEQAPSSGLIHDVKLARQIALVLPFKRPISNDFGIARLDRELVGTSS